jgi:hypothetical protein
LTNEFEKVPVNYNVLDALSNPDHITNNIKKWSELGVLYAEDIIRNSKTPVDYHLRVSENDLACAFG